MDLFALVLNNAPPQKVRYCFVDPCTLATHPLLTATLSALGSLPAGPLFEVKRTCLYSGQKITHPLLSVYGGLGD